MSDVRLGPVSVRYSGDEQRAREYLPAAMQWLRITQERQRAGAVDTMRYVRQLAEDAYCHVTLGGGMAILHIVVGAATLAGDGEIARDLVPDFVSGAIQRGYIEPEFPDLANQPDKLARFKPTERCFWRYFREQGSDQWLRANYSHVLRLAVEPHESFPELRNQNPESTTVFSQYTKLKPTMFSGTMRKCVQALMGFGRQRKKPPKFQVETSLYEQAPKPSDVRMADVTANYAQDVRENGLQIRYDWRWSCTHGLARAADGAWWLVEISKARGIIAMPLPLHASTTSPEFREWIERSGDEDALRLLDEFGGFPTGQSFPDDVEPWVDAGLVVRLLATEGMADYYEHTGYSEDIGWAFNLRGDEAHNTAWRFGDDGVQRGVHYACTMRIGAMDEYEPATIIAEGLESLRGKEGYEDLDSVQWKCGRLSQVQKLAAQTAGSAKAMYAYVKSASVPPLATGSGSVSQVSEGYLWFPPAALENNGNIIRFPDTGAGHLVSHDMRPNSKDAPMPARCDTTMFVFFAGNTLKWVKFFWDTGPGGAPKNEDDYEECMYIGSWSKHEEGGQRQIPRMFYTNDIDDRRELTPWSRDTRIKSEDLGYCAVVTYDRAPPYANEGGCYRVKRFRRREEVEYFGQISVMTGVAVPIGEREAYYYAKYQSTAGYERKIKYSYNYLSDPWAYAHWRNRSLYTGRSEGQAPSDGDPDAQGTWITLDQHPTGYGPVTVRTICTPGQPYTIGNHIMGSESRDGVVYNPYPCGDIADSGPWLQGGENATSLAYEIPEPPLPPNEEETIPYQERYDVWLVSSHDSGMFHVSEVENGGFGWWPIQTPDLSGSVQYAYETHTVLGEATAMRYSTDINSVQEMKGAPQWPEMMAYELTFVGVIDG